MLRISAPPTPSAVRLDTSDTAPATSTRIEVAVERRDLFRDPVVRDAVRLTCQFKNLDTDGASRSFRRAMTSGFGFGMPSSNRRFSSASPRQTIASIVSCLPQRTRTLATPRRSGRIAHALNDARISP
jgi:hypothetical protein